MRLLNHVGDVNLGIHDFAEFAPVVVALETQGRGRIPAPAHLSNRNIYRRGVVPRDR